MQKRSTRFFVMSVVAAALAAGCATSKSAEGGSSDDAETTAAGGVAQRHTAEHAVTDSEWAQVESGPLTVVGIVGVGRFDGVSQCYASEGPSCGNASSAPEALGTRVFNCEGSCSPENGGRVGAGQVLCCGASQGNGGKLRITYVK